MAGVFLGMSAGTLVATGLSAAGSLYSYGANQSKANTQSRIAGDERRQQDKMIAQARDTIGASNANRLLALDKKTYNDQLDALMAAQGGQNLDEADQRNVTAGAARQQAIMTKGLENVTQRQIKEGARINELVAKQDIDISEKLAGLDIGEANLAAENAKAADKRAIGYQTAANKAMGDFVGDVVTPLAEFGGAQLDSHIAGKGLIDAGGAAKLGAAGMSAFNPEDMSNITNDALKDALISNPEFGVQLSALYDGGNIPDNQAVTDLFVNSLDYDTIRNISSGF